MLSPKSVKRRKVQQGKMRGTAYRGSSLTFGDYGLQAQECGKISSRQIEAARIAMTRYTKRGGNTWIKIFPDKPLTKKPLETRMGKGKGGVEEWVAVVKPGRIIYEIGGLGADVASEALRRAAHELPIKCKVVTRAGMDELRKQATA